MTVIATGFDDPEEEKVIDLRRPRAEPSSRSRASEPASRGQESRGPADQVESRPQQRVAVGGGRDEGVLPLGRMPERTVTRSQISELDIPTFIRRQMD